MDVVITAPLTAPSEQKVPVPWDPKRDQDEACPVDGCGHPYHRHFDSYGSGDPYDGAGEPMPAVGCKYCDCWAFAGMAVPVPPKVGTTGYMLWIITGDTYTTQAACVMSVHATDSGAHTALSAWVGQHWDRHMSPDVERPDDAVAAAETLLGYLDGAFRIEPVVIQA